MENYCAAEHENSAFGCCGLEGHTGNHWCWGRHAKDGSGVVTEDFYPFHQKFFWDDAPETFTQEELAVLAVLVLQVDRLYPELGPKLLRIKEATK